MTLVNKVGNVSEECVLGTNAFIRILYAQKFLKGKESTISFRYGWANLSLGSLFDIT